nr:MAG TPA: hypothetical protein [Caudoviricetes sp.]
MDAPLSPRGLELLLTHPAGRGPCHVDVGRGRAHTLAASERPDEREEPQ